MVILNSNWTSCFNSTSFAAVKPTKVKQQTDEVLKVKSKLPESTKHVNNSLSEFDLKVPPTCSLCGTTFGNKYLLKRHLQNVHATEKRFKCDMCERTFVSSVYLNAHKRYGFPKIGKILRCFFLFIL